MLRRQREYTGYAMLCARVTFTRRWRHVGYDGDSAAAIVIITS